jgi:alpha-galactosidase
MKRLLQSVLFFLLFAQPQTFQKAAKAPKPFMGWSSWSLEAVRSPNYNGEDWLTAEHVREQSDAMHRLLQKYGYRYINLDSGWKGGYDAFGRPLPDRKKFPDGIAAIARYVHQYGQKLGIYYTVGIWGDLYQANPQILGTPYHLRDILVQPPTPGNGWVNGTYKIDFSKPAAKAYIASIAQQFANWGVDLLKLDGVTPGSDHNDLSIDNRAEVAAWAQALQQTGRPIWLELSWNLDAHYADFWQRYANGWRISDDIDRYGPTLTSWPQVRARFEAAARWYQNAGPTRGWNDFDSLDIGNGAMDGLTDAERQTMMTLWAIECSPLYTGDDLTQLDSYGLQLLTNAEVIAVDQAGHLAHPVRFGPQQVWAIQNPDGSFIVALFNLDDHTPAAVTVTWWELGLTGPVKAHDLWSHRDLGIYNNRFTQTLAPHACCLVRLIPQKN